MHHYRRRHYTAFDITHINIPTTENNSHIIEDLTLVGRLRGSYFS